MRTTVRLDEHQLKQAKQYATASGKTLTTNRDFTRFEGLRVRNPVA